MERQKISVIKQIFPGLNEPSVIILDLAPYHRERVPGTWKPNTTFLKAKIHEWFNTYGHPYDDKWTKKQLLEQVKMLPDTTKYVLEEAAREMGHELLWLPPGMAYRLNFTDNRLPIFGKSR